MVVSAGILPYRQDDAGGWEVMLAHPGGPYWRRRDDGWWTIIKGQLEPDEDPLLGAKREFREETGWQTPEGGYIELGSIRQRAGKVVLGWAVAAIFSPAELRPGVFELEFPPNSGHVQTFPEIDRVGWFLPDDARQKLLPSQHPFLDRLAELLK